MFIIGGIVNDDYNVGIKAYVYENLSEIYV